jgi:prevent-host-death family protein
MSKTVTASEAKNRLGAIMDWAVENEDGVVIEKRGEPRVVVIPYAQYERLQALQEQLRRAEALARLEQAAQQMSGATEALSDEEVEALAEEIARDTVERMVAEGKIKYKVS